MGTVSKPFPYRLLYALAPASFRARHGQAIDGQLRNRLAAQIRHGDGRLAFWLRAMIELAGALPALWLAAARQRGTGRFSPHDKDTPMSGLVQDLRYGLRGLYARPGMSAKPTSPPARRSTAIQGPRMFQRRTSSPSPLDRAGRLRAARQTVMESRDDFTR